MNNKQSIFTLSLICWCLISSTMAKAACHPDIIKMAPDSRYILSFEEDMAIVFDKKTNLTWQRCSHAQQWSFINNDCSELSGFFNAGRWTQALAAPLKLFHPLDDENVIEQTDWRLPNIKELASLVETACENPAINSDIFPNTHSSRFLSATATAPVTINRVTTIWYVDFTSGLVRGVGFSSGGVVRLVRSNGQP